MELVWNSYREIGHSRARRFIKGVRAQLRQRFPRKRYSQRAYVESVFSVVKQNLSAKVRTREALEAAIRQAIATVSESDARAWFKHCGYVLH